MMIATQYNLIMPIGQFWVDGCHLDGGQDQCGLGGHQGGRKVVVQELHGILELVNYDHVGDNICCWNIGR